MISDYRCFFCFTRAFEKLVNNSAISREQKNEFTRELAAMYALSNDRFSAPAFARELHVLLRNYTHQQDPFIEEKRNSNDLVLEMYPELKHRVMNAQDPFNVALRLAIAGNIIDFAVSSQFNLSATIDHVLSSDFSIDNSGELRQALNSANSVLYLGDNCGEIVFDKLFIETIMHHNLHFAVRGAPAINDATMEDAHYVKMDLVADLISNGYDAPSTLLEHCSDDFLQAFDQADVIIAKGQGNLEGLMGKTNKRIFFLLMVKCDVIAQALGVNKGHFVVIDNHQFAKTQSHLTN